MTFPDWQSLRTHQLLSQRTQIFGSLRLSISLSGSNTTIKNTWTVRTP